MPTTRAMAKQAFVTSDDKENEIGHSLRKKPVRRANTKTASAKAKGRKATQQEEAAWPLSPKKVTQTSHARTRQTQSELTGAKITILVDNNNGPVKARRAATRQAAGTQPASAPDFDLEQRSRPQAPKVRQTRKNNAAQGGTKYYDPADVHNEPAAKRLSLQTSPAVDRNCPEDRIATSPSNNGTPGQGTPRRSLAGTPMENKTISMPARHRFAPQYQIDITSTDLDALSDDELCGPKTPLHRFTSKAISPERNACASNIGPEQVHRRSSITLSVNTFKTPQKEMLVYRMGENQPQTTKVPLKPADTSLPRRPMSVTRGSSVAYVFHPLPKASRVHSPLKGPYQWPVTPSDEEDDPIDDDERASVASSRKSSGSRSNAGSRPNTPGSRRSTITPQVRERFTQLFLSGSDEDTEDDDEDESVADYFPHLRQTDASGSVAAAEFEPEAESEESEDDLDADLEDDLVQHNSALTSEEGSLCDESADLSEDTPQLPSGIFESTPSYIAPDVSRLALESSPASEDELAGTPTLTRLSHLTSSSIGSTPRRRVSFNLGGGEISNDLLQTPKSRPRLSNFRTPHMRSALEEFDDASLITPGAEVPYGTLDRERTICIDPSLLSSQDTEPLSPRKDSVQTNECDFDISTKPIPTLQSKTVSGQMAPLIASPKTTRNHEARLSLLLNTDGLVEDDQDDEDTWLADGDTTVLMKRTDTHQEQATVGAEGTGPSDESQVDDSSVVDGSVLHNTTTNHVNFPTALAQSLFDPSFLEEDTTPHYALPTVSSDIRRKSMPMLSSHTPKSNTSRPRTAETNVKSTATPSQFAKLWLDRQDQPSAPPSRRQSMLSVTASASTAQLLPSSLPRAISSLPLRKRASVQSVRDSYVDPATPIMSATAPRPRCYTPSSVVASLKMASAKPTPVPVSPPRKLSSPKKTISPRNVQTPARATPSSTRNGAFTPHPNAPLRGVVAYVEVFTCSALPASASFVTSLQRLGAKTVKTFTDNVTHVVWKDGSPATLAKVKSARREGRDIAIVGSRWVVECDSLGERVDESREEFVVDMDGMIGGQRRRKSLEPKALTALNGPTLTPGRSRSSRMSVASEAWAESPMKGGSHEDHMPFSDDEDEWFEETPVRERSQLDAPGSVPVQRIQRGGVILSLPSTASSHPIKMAVLPAALSLPLAVSSLAYLNAKTNFTQDAGLLKNMVVGAIKTLRACKHGRVNMFYNLEEHALSSKKANHPFLVVPPQLPKDVISSSVEEVKSLKGEEWTYREAYDIVLKYAQWLKEEHGIKKYDIVALDCGNKPVFVFVWFALWSLGARPAFINTSLRGESFLHCVKTSSSKLLIVEDDLKDTLTSEVTSELSKLNVPSVILDSTLHSHVLTLKGHRACDDCRSGIEPTDMAMLIFTSGTTGLPKPAVLTWKRYHGTTHSIYPHLEFRSTERYYTALPLYHSSASMLGLGPVLASGTTLILSPHFSPRTFFPSLVATRATSVQYIGEMCRYLLTSPPTPFDTAHTVERFFGNGIRPDVWLPFKSRFAIPQIAEFYGATESPASTFIKSRNNFGEGAIGRRGLLVSLLTGSQSILVRHDVETGEPVRDATTGLCVRCAPDEPGELLGWVDPANIKEKFAGYWGDEAAGQNKILRDVLKKGDAYFRTGDLIRTDKEGRSFFVDRVGDTFRWKGENVSTGEVEKVLAGAEGVGEVVVYGVQLPGHDGRAGCAAVLFKGEGEVSDATLEKLGAYVKERLPRFAWPLFLRRVKGLDTTGTSKYQKQGLRTQGVDPAKTGSDEVWWLQGGTGGYRRFGDKEWKGVVAGQTRL
ncbi:hypothetical protein KVT40_000081 [Elsinoe batatas]|uniref:Very long-chain fatty acid transport protein n=1 Tax=Elsinoe batatas TaxID=2601811 RepID=A0A8K0L6P7_9PEZI|nr:hypothetical protein KVT40_000081 [Elsinoe batatas]